MKWIQNDKWEKWFAWHKVFICGTIGKSFSAIAWLEFVERRVIVERGVGSIRPYVIYEYREYNQLPKTGRSKAHKSTT